MRAWGRIVPVVAPLAAALLIAGLVIQLTGGSAWAAFSALARGAFGDASGLLRTLARATPLLLTGLAVALALRAGLFNIGAEGQLIMGALAAAWVGFSVGGLPLPLHLPLAMLAGMLAGALWAAIPGILKAWRGTHEVIVTIMMNYIAFELTRWLVNNPLRDRTTLATATPAVRPSARLWALGDWNPAYAGTNFSAGFLLAILAAILFAFVIRRTALGFEIRATGLGPDAARANGIPVKATMVRAMLLSGALAGLAGAVEALGVHRRFLDAFSPGYGFDSIAVALLGGLSAPGVALSAILFGALSSGALAMEALTGVPRQIGVIVQAVVIIGAGSRFVRRSG